MFYVEDFVEEPEYKHRLLPVEDCAEDAYSDLVVVEELDEMCHLLHIRLVPERQHDISQWYKTGDVSKTPDF